VDGPGRAARWLRFIDLLPLVVGLPVFIAADLPLLGYAVVAAVWLLALGLELAGERIANRELESGNRRGAMGWIALTGLSRVWLVALAVLLVGLLDDRDAGLAGAVFAAVLFSFHLVGRVMSKLLTPGERR
jgi:hypothetical protein